MTGDGLTQNIPEGLKYLFKAAQQGNDEVIQALGKYKSLGMPIPDWNK